MVSCRIQKNQAFKLNFLNVPVSLLCKQILCLTAILPKVCSIYKIYFTLSITGRHILTPQRAQIADIGDLHGFSPRSQPWDIKAIKKGSIFFLRNACHKINNRYGFSGIMTDSFQQIPCLLKPGREAKTHCS